MLRELAGTARDLGRLQEIGVVLLRYGFGDFARRLGIRLPWRAAETAAAMAAPARVRHALQDLGPTFVKLGQILATRVDLFAPEWIAEFEKLQDQAPPAPWPEVRAQLVEDLGAPPEEVFAVFNPVPIAAGSVAQVHRAQLANGSAVAVKVRRPEIRAVVEADLRLLARLTGALESHVDDFARFHAREVVRQFTRTMRAELDLAAECRNAERVAQSFRDDPAIVVPGVYWEWSDLTSLQSFGRQVDTSANRLAIGIVTAALIVGSAIVMTIEGGPTLFGLPFFGVLGFAGALVGGVWLFVSILRSGGGR
jgi:ubiquinone biosynthesis protein